MHSLTPVATTPATVPGAIVILLRRLWLRAADTVNMRLTDIDWQQVTLLVQDRDAAKSVYLSHSMPETRFWTTLNMRASRSVSTVCSPVQRRRFNYSDPELSYQTSFAPRSGAQGSENPPQRRMEEMKSAAGKPRVRHLPIRASQSHHHQRRSDQFLNGVPFFGRPPLR